MAGELKTSEEVQIFQEMTEKFAQSFISGFPQCNVNCEQVMSNSSCALLYSRGRADMLVIRDQRIKKETGKISTSSHKFKLWYKKEGRRHANKK